MQIIAIEYGQYYHVYNRGVNSCVLFAEESNYEYFLSLYDKYIDPIAETYAWVLMPNHFHFLIRIKDAPVKHTDISKTKPLHQHFSNFFNAYTKAFNKRFNRHGPLFERPFRRKLVTSEAYLKNLILYIHTNPVRHGFCTDAIEYPWSSYLTYVSVKPTKWQKEVVMGWFDDNANFKYLHSKGADGKEIENW